MADEANEMLQKTVRNITSTAKPPSTPSGMVVAFGSLVIMAMLPIFFGSIRSVKHNKLKKESGHKVYSITSKDAIILPIFASCALLLLKSFSKNNRYTDISDTSDTSDIFDTSDLSDVLDYFIFFFGIEDLSHLLSPIISSLISTVIPKIPYHILFTKGSGNKKENIISYKFSTHDIICLIISIIIGVWYYMDKHWIANNLFGLAFAANGVELLRLSNVLTGCILLSGFLIYDIFWVFGTNIMVTVATSFEAPFKLVFPEDLITNGLNASNFAMLGLGDIVIPGIFIALLLRFDNSLKRQNKIYFYATFIAYFFGLLATLFVMYMFKHGQPALLYLVPACIGTPLLLAFIKGDIKILFAYKDHLKGKKKEKEAKQNKEKERKQNKEKDSKKSK